MALTQYKLALAIKPGLSKSIGVQLGKSEKGHEGIKLVYSGHMHTRTCLTCNSEFSTNISAKKYCSERCKPAPYAEKTTLAFKRWSEIDIFGDKKNS